MRDRDGRNQAEVNNHKCKLNKHILFLTLNDVLGPELPTASRYTHDFCEPVQVTKKMTIHFLIQVSFTYSGSGISRGGRQPQRRGGASLILGMKLMKILQKFCP